MNILHDAIHDSSHYQLHILADGSEPVIPDGQSLVKASGTALNIAADWPEDGEGDPAVRLVVALAATPTAFPGQSNTPTHTVASLPLSIRGGQLTVGDIIMCDTATLTLPPGQYQADVFLDTKDIFKARHIFVGLSPLA